MLSSFCIKVCKSCNSLLVANTSNYRKKKGGKYGLYTVCKTCERELSRKYYAENKEKEKLRKQKYVENNREKVNESVRLWRRNNPQKAKEINKRKYQNNKEKIKERNAQYKKEHSEFYSSYNKEYYQKNKDKINECKRRYVENNKEKVRLYHRQYYIENIDKFINYRNLRKEKSEKQGRGINKEQWLECYSFFEWKCAYSGVSLNKNNRTIDHIVALANGGEHEIWNIVPMLDVYNYQKQKQDMLTWYKEKDYFTQERLDKIYEWINYSYEKWGKNEHLNEVS